MKFLNGYYSNHFFINEKTKYFHFSLFFEKYSPQININSNKYTKSLFFINILKIELNYTILKKNGFKRRRHSCGT